MRTSHPIAAIVLAADVGLFVWQLVGRSAGAAPSGRFAVFASLRALALHLAGHVARFLLVDILPGCLLVAGLPKGAAGMLGLGILVDRLSFYLLAAQHTTEAEIARVEGEIAGAATRG